MSELNADRPVNPQEVMKNVQAAREKTENVTNFLGNALDSAMNVAGNELKKSQEKAQQIEKSIKDTEKILAAKENIASQKKTPGNK